MKVYESTSYESRRPELFDWKRCKEVPLQILAECFISEVLRCDSALTRHVWRDALAYLAGLATVEDAPLLGGYRGETQVPGRKAEGEAGRG